MLCGLDRAHASDHDEPLQSTSTPFSIAFHLATPHGVATGVHLPDGPDPVSTEVLSALHPDEALHAVELKGYRQPQFVGGRLALREARRQLGLPLGPILPDDRGAPAMPDGFTASISHKRTLAVAMVARDHDGTLGIDLEERAPSRLRIAERILRPEELAAIAELGETERWHALLLRFSLKESIYKALDPWVRRYVGFHEALVDVGRDGEADVTLELKGGEGPFQVDARYHWLPSRVLTSVRIRPVDATSPAPPHLG